MNMWLNLIGAATGFIAAALWLLAATKTPRPPEGAYFGASGGPDTPFAHGSVRRG